MRPAIPFAALLLVASCRAPSSAPSAPAALPPGASGMAVGPQADEHPDREAIETKRVSDRTTVDARLLELYEADQADRTPGPGGIDWTVVSPRDRVREAEVLERVEAGAPKVADDWYHAAMIMQHGEGEAPIERAHAWALRAVELDPDHASARWLAAAAEDRLLMRRGVPQRYGTQYVKRDGRWVLYEVDESVSDEERAAWNVPPLAEAQRRAEQMNADRR